MFGARYAGSELHSDPDERHSGRGIDSVWFGGMYEGVGVYSDPGVRASESGVLVSDRGGQRHNN